MSIFVRSKSQSICFSCNGTMLNGGFVAFLLLFLTTSFLPKILVFFFFFTSETNDEHSYNLACYILYLQRFQMSSHNGSKPQTKTLFLALCITLNLTFWWLTFHICDMVILANWGLCWHYRNPVGSIMCVSMMQQQLNHLNHLNNLISLIVLII